MDYEKFSRNELVYAAKLAEQTERYDEMSAFMKQVATKWLETSRGHDCSDGHDPSDCPECYKRQLSVEERNLLSVAYKNQVGARRASWRIITSQEPKEKATKDRIAEWTKHDRLKVENELDEICSDILTLLDKVLIPNSEISDAESRVFYHKMKGDYYRYICEFSAGEKHDKAVKCAKDAYGEAKKIAEAQLATTNPIRLGLTLNHSVFLYEIISDVSAAVNEAKHGFDLALADFDHVTEDIYKDSTLIMQLLRDNMTLWCGDMSSNANDEKNEEADKGRDDSDPQQNGADDVKEAPHQEETNEKRESTAGTEGSENVKKEFVQ